MQAHVESGDPSDKAAEDESVQRDQCACAFTEAPFIAIAASSSSLIELGSTLARVCEIGWVSQPNFSNDDQYELA
jgi:hypothetical protein